MRSSLRTAGLVATVVGGIASVVLLFYVGNREGSAKSQPVVLMLIGIWVLSPYIVLLGADAISKKWSDMSRAALYGMMLVIPVISLCVYVATAAGPIRAKPAAPFVAIPPLSWLFIAVALAFAAFIARRQQPR
jgi:hypothetical protein